MGQTTYAYALLAQNDQPAAEMRRIVDETEGAVAHIEAQKRKFPGEEAIFDTIIYMRRQYQAIAQRLLDAPARAREASTRNR